MSNLRQRENALALISEDRHDSHIKASRHKTPIKATPQETPVIHEQSCGAPFHRFLWKLKREPVHQGLFPQEAPATLPGMLEYIYKVATSNVQVRGILLNLKQKREFEPRQ